MAQRMQQGGRPGGARFAQFKLVLLGWLRSHVESLRARYADSLKVNPLSERVRSCSALSRCDKDQLAYIGTAILTRRVGPIR